MVALVHQRGRTADLHAIDPFADRTVTEPELWWCDITDAAFVLGSRQSPDLVDLAACERAGLDLVRRRSGGGAVVLRPADIVWIDAVLPHGVAPADVRDSMVWIGERWRDAVAPVVPAGTDLTVHTGGMHVDALVGPRLFRRRRSRRGARRTVASSSGSASAAAVTGSACRAWFTDASISRRCPTCSSATARRARSSSRL